MQEDKLTTWPSQPILTGVQDAVDGDVLVETDRLNHDKVNTVDRQSRAAFSFGQKKRDPHSPVPVDELRQASGPTHVIVADARPESSTRD